MATPVLSSSISVTNVHSDPRPSSRAKKFYSRLSEKSFDGTESFPDTCKCCALIGVNLYASCCSAKLSTVYTVQTLYCYCGTTCTRKNLCSNEVS